MSETNAKQYELMQKFSELLEKHSKEKASFAQLRERENIIIALIIYFFGSLLDEGLTDENRMKIVGAVLSNKPETLSVKNRATYYDMCSAIRNRGEFQNVVNTLRSQLDRGELRGLIEALQNAYREYPEEDNLSKALQIELKSQEPKLEHEIEPINPALELSVSPEDILPNVLPEIKDDEKINIENSEEDNGRDNTGNSEKIDIKDANDEINKDKRIRTEKVAEEEKQQNKKSENKEINAFIEKYGFCLESIFVGCFLRDLPYEGKVEYRYGPFIEDFEKLLDCNETFRKMTKKEKVSQEIEEFEFLNKCFIPYVLERFINPKRHPKHDPKPIEEKIKELRSAIENGKNVGATLVDGETDRTFTVFSLIEKVKIKTNEDGNGKIASTNFYEIFPELVKHAKKNMMSFKNVAESVVQAWLKCDNRPYHLDLLTGDENGEKYKNYGEKRLQECIRKELIPLIIDLSKKRIIKIEKSNKSNKEKIKELEALKRVIADEKGDSCYDKKHAMLDETIRTIEEKEVNSNISILTSLINNIYVKENLCGSIKESNFYDVYPEVVNFVSENNGSFDLVSEKIIDLWLTHGLKPYHLDLLTGRKNDEKYKNDNERKLKLCIRKRLIPVIMDLSKKRIERIEKSGKNDEEKLSKLSSLKSLIADEEGDTCYHEKHRILDEAIHNLEIKIKNENVPGPSVDPLPGCYNEEPERLKIEITINTSVIDNRLKMIKLGQKGNEPSLYVNYE